MKITFATVFVIDDDVDVCDSLEAVIAMLGHACIAFPSAESLFATDTLDVSGCLIVDVNLPGMTGIEMLTVLRKQGNRTPAILYTAHVDEKVRRAATMIENVTVLPKGGTTTTLMECLESILKQFT
jgi:FixJ family two-component response regulator